MTQGSPAQDPIVADDSRPYFIEPKWDLILTTSSSRTFRMAVAGGWIIEQHRRDLTGACPTHSLSICFVPDEKHYWQVIGVQ